MEGLWLYYKKQRNYEQHIDIWYDTSADARGREYAPGEGGDVES